MAGLFQNYCVHPGDKLLFIYSNAAKSNICNSNIQCDSNTAENKHLISLFVGIFVSLFRCMFEVLYLCMQCASSFSPSLFSAHTFQTTQEWDKRIKSGLGLRNGEYTHTHTVREWEYNNEVATMLEYKINPFHVKFFWDWQRFGRAMHKITFSQILCLFRSFSHFLRIYLTNGKSEAVILSVSRSHYHWLACYHCVKWFSLASYISRCCSA